jgi:DNA-binding CsgD family transcriptional regulator
MGDAKSKRGENHDATGAGGTAEGAVSSLLRHTGISIASEMPWGAHICIFYETAADLAASCVAYFQAGLESNEACLWAISGPITIDEALSALRDGIPKFDQHLNAGQIELLPGHEWYLDGNEFHLQRITGGWWAKLNDALARGYDGLRISGNAFWIECNQWKEFDDYEKELDRSLADKKMIVMCTYALDAARGVDILDVARAHQYTITRRNGEWEVLETPELKQAKREIRKLNSVIDILLEPAPGRLPLTSRERTVLAHIVRGVSSKEAARALGVAPRTIEFHRANIMRKLGARNTIELVQRMLDA